MNPNESSKQRSRRKPGRRTILLAIALLAVAGIGILTAAYVIADRLTEPGDPVMGVSAIAVRDNSFSPDAVQVTAGTTITWTWEGDAKHNIHGDGLDAPSQTEGTYTHTFDEPGTYDYECTLHFGMKGRVIVTEGELGA
jgi:plastocyanin